MSKWLSTESGIPLSFESGKPIKVSYTFQSTWKTDNPGVSNSDQIALPLIDGGEYDFVVKWGDGTQDTITVWNQAETTHTYGSGAGTYTVQIDGIINGWNFNLGGDCQKLLDISAWGTLRLSNNPGDIGHYFDGCTNLTIRMEEFKKKLEERIKGGLKEKVVPSNGKGIVG
jgi:hypothetical protein